MKTKVTLLMSLLILIPAISMAGEVVDGSIFSTSSPEYTPDRAWLDCTGAYVEYIMCGVPYTGTTVGDPNWADTYICSTDVYTGNEGVHILSLSQAADLTATLEDSIEPQLDVLILTDCDTDNCVAYGDSVATLTNAQPGTYYIIVDGRNAANDVYTLTVTCDILPTPTPSPTPTTPPVPSTTTAGILVLVLGMTLILGLLTWKFSAAKLQ